MISRLLSISAVSLALAAFIRWATGIPAIFIGRFTVSLASPSHFLFWAAAAALAAVMLRPAWRSRQHGFSLVVGLFLAAAAVDSPMRVVGDGHEYLAMSRNLVLGRPPSVVVSDVKELQRELGEPEDSAMPPLDPKLRDREGRFAFPHFWLFPMLAAPFVAAARALHQPLMAGVTVFNIACATLAVWYLFHRCGPEVAVIVVCALLWWIDKAHAEVFFVATATLGLLLLDRHPAAALPVLGLLPAQLPVFAGVLATALAVTTWRYRRSRGVWMAAAASVGIAAVYPWYYVAHIGRWSPLPDVGGLRFLDVRLVSAPLVDLNLGIAWYAPVAALLCAVGPFVGPRIASRRAMLVAGVGATALLLVAAQSQNVNSGGTPGPSRYGLWCVGLAVPMIANAAAAIATVTGQCALRALALLTLAFSAIVLHPSVIDQGTLPRPSTAAAWVWTRMPAWNNPPPEVFAERLSHTDGKVPIPMATLGCEKVLLVGRAGDVWWPKWCAPAPVRPECGTSYTLCYWNQGTTSIAPRQALFDTVVASGRHLASIDGRDLE